MSQNPGQPQYPYQPPGGSYGYGYPSADPMREILAPARRAGTLQMILGSLGLLCGLCAALAGMFLFTPEFLAQQPGFALPPGITVQQLRTVAILSGVLYIVGGLLLLILGAFVGKGNKGTIYASIVIVGLAGLLLLVNAGLQAKERNAMGALVGFVLIGLLLWLMSWLFQAVNASNQAAALAQQYQYQMMYQQQQQQMYGGAGFGPWSAPMGPGQPGQPAPGQWPPQQPQTPGNPPNWPPLPPPSTPG